MRWVAQWEDIPNSEKYNVDGREANFSPCKSGGKVPEKKIDLLLDIERICAFEVVQKNP